MNTTPSTRCVTICFGGLAAAAVLLSSSAALADVAIAGDLDYAIPINEKPDPGAGFGVRLGSRYKAPLIAVTPEVGFTYHGFSGASTYRGLGGLRLAVGEILTPGVFGHLGVGRFSAQGNASTGFTYDVGGFLDFTVIPLINIGAHAAYNRTNRSSGASAFDWATVGLHAALIL